MKPLSPFRCYGPFFRASLAAIVVGVLLGGSIRGQDSAPQNEFEQKLEHSPTLPPADELSSADIAAVQQFGDTLGIADWLGPLAPVALSPFFGITCLSGMSLYGEGWISADNAFLGENSPLHNESVFWTFLVLTALTSVPRFTKVSKPVAQALDRVEAWAGIITLVVLKVLMSRGAPESVDLPEVAVMNAGVFSFSSDVLLIIAGAINIFVINAVKFFFEVLIWLTPLPTVDAIFEVCNKSLCAILMAIYGYSPTLATVINLAMFAIAALVFRWAYRRQIFFRTMLIDGAFSLFAPKTTFEPQELTVFPNEVVQGQGRLASPGVPRSRSASSAGGGSWYGVVPKHQLAPASFAAAVSNAGSSWAVAPSASGKSGPSS